MSGDRFPRVGALRSGYSMTQVDDYLSGVEAAMAGRGEPVAAADIRAVGFDLVRGGYEPHSVDFALDRLEQRAVELELRAGRPAGAASLDGAVDQLLAELAGPPGGRFPRAGRFERGYDPGDVDAFCDRVAGSLTGGPGPGPRAVRAAVFRPRRGGYAEPEVDEFFDRVVDVLLRQSVYAP